MSGIGDATSPVASGHRGDLRKVTKSTVVEKPKSSVTSEQNTQQKRMSFSSIVQASKYPKKDQAVVFPVVEGIQVKDYVYATGEVVEPEDILFVSRISNNRVCMYFSSKQVVNEFIDQHGGIQINDVFIPARKLIVPAKRIILSNVAPAVPDSVIEEQLRERGIKLVSPMSLIGAGCSRDRFRHICSFRRQIFISTEQNVAVPGSILVKYEDEEHRIFISDDKVRCFKCRREGHIAASCDVSTTDLEIPVISNKRPPPSTTETTDERSIQVLLSSQNSVEEEEGYLQETRQETCDDSTVKMTLINETLIDQEMSRVQTNREEPTRASKKLKLSADAGEQDPYREVQKTSTGVGPIEPASCSAANDTELSACSSKHPISSATALTGEVIPQDRGCLSSIVQSHPAAQTQSAMEDVLSPRPIITESRILSQDSLPEPMLHEELKSKAKKPRADPKDNETYRHVEQIWRDEFSTPLDCLNFTQFLNEVKGSNKQLDVARIYTSDIEGLLHQLKIVIKLLTQRAIKERCRRLTVSLKKAMMQEGIPVPSPPNSRSSSVASLRLSTSQESLDSY